ncbi:macro domain-containing protein [Cystobacter ferrugineus]|uniref:Appr-1-p processing protein n=1 Tax=Cystobacter ferrugineus TaxID=83449 RepID=A0A1L9BE29_9BACT|nr:macro domain-containing protein [Cystobacter ferrugineus]OJH40478.1 Appr-1-p processing protein [Cystobacter ferrugineus]
MIQVVEGDLLDQRADAIVNAWNRNIIPWWLLLPQGVSGAIKRRGGLQPFRELGRVGPMPLGSAVVTSAGRLPYQGIIHVAGINMLWRASERSIRDSARNALARARERSWRSLAFPVIGAGSGGFNEERALSFLLSALEEEAAEFDLTVVRYRQH